MFKLVTIITLLFVSMTAFAEEVENPDPLEGLNRGVWGFNETVINSVARPVVDIYETVTPTPIRNAIVNFFGNLNEIPNAANSLLQGKVKQAANDTGRFLINTTLGLAGLFDVAKSAGLHAGGGEDFGQTLAVWGVGQGPYLMLPFIGPTTFRDAPADFIDSFLDPFSYSDKLALRIGVKSISMIAENGSYLDQLDVISGDKYLFIRDVYLQNREYVINDGAIEDDFGDLDDY
ncbi:MAG TPA: VacJ family lipoprotein [Porticoccaceae bacterium]|nr:VacJ family lipoprotein [Porticoccaceae bacterium]